MNIVQDYYNTKTSDYSPSKKRIRKIIELIGQNLHGKKILEFGCGNGILGKKLRDLGAVVTGCDISGEYEQITKENLDNFFIFDVENGDYSIFKKEYDFIIASELIEHLFSTERFSLKVKENIMDNHSRLILTTPNFLVWTNRIKMLMGKFYYKKSGFFDESHIHFFTYNSLKQLVGDLGYKIEAENHIIHPKIPEFIGKFIPNFSAYQIFFKLKLKKC